MLFSACQSLSSLSWQEASCCWLVRHSSCQATAKDSYYDYMSCCSSSQDYSLIRTGRCPFEDLDCWDPRSCIANHCIELVDLNCSVCFDQSSSCHRTTGKVSLYSSLARCLLANYAAASNYFDLTKEDRLVERSMDAVILSCPLW